MAKYVGYKRPKNTKKAMKNLLRYLGYHKWLLLLVAVLVAISSGHCRHLSYPPGHQ